MKMKKIAGALAAAMVVSFGSASAQSESSVARPAERVVEQAVALDRDAVVEVILGTWEGSEYAVDGADRSWRDAMRPVLEGADEANLRRAMDALEFPVMLAALQGQVDGPRVTPSALGDPSSDLVYTPIEPCRILDTRVAGGQIPADSSRSFDGSPFLNGSFAFQGGDDSDCGIPASRPSAVMLNITVVNPQGNGYLTAYPFGSDVPLAASLNYASGAVIGNEVLTTMNPTGGWDFRIYTFRQAHVVADAVGYFMAPEATALDCETESIAAAPLAPGARRFESISCPAGYTVMSGGAESGFNEGLIINSISLPGDINAPPNGVGISVTNSGAISRDVSYSARCCRVPGR